MGDIDPVSGHIERLQRALTDARGKATSADGTLRVEVGANGTLHSVELGEGGADLDPRVLVSMIVDLHREAVADAAAVMREAVAALGSDPRLQEGRQEVVDKLARPRPVDENPDTTASSTTGDTSPAEEPHPPTRASVPTPDDTPAVGGEPPRTTPSLPPPPAPRPAPPARAPRRPAAPARLSEFDPVTFAPVTRPRPLSTPAVDTDRPRRATPPRAPTRTDQPWPSSSTAEHAPVEPGNTPPVSPPDTTASTAALPAEESPTARPALEVEIVPWGEPADDTAVNDEGWPPDDHLTLSSDWWNLPSPDGR
ncbi:YbaB/EbfC family nucleoid-associated protein [Nocardia sp. AG03]|uniref:YbaB/EbfC family nucleoid-associated protein n=1 Tax=Nocardia sp. AG03 TaxID=3025312 RepID=UPI002418242D|nr:YbaB/EbfC family nucleoid-associated protein [Nocardia sp. AG03]